VSALVFLIIVDFVTEISTICSENLAPWQRHAGIFLKDKEFHGQDMDNNKEASQLPER
jgi:hypothetical protein